MTRWPSTWLVAPQRSRLASSMQSHPPASSGSGSAACGRARPRRAARPGRSGHRRPARCPAARPGWPPAAAPRWRWRGCRRNRCRAGPGCGRIPLRKCPPGRGYGSFGRRHSPRPEGLFIIGPASFSYHATMRWIQPNYKLRAGAGHLVQGSRRRTKIGYQEGNGDPSCQQRNQELTHAAGEAEPFVSSASARDNRPPVRMSWRRVPVEHVRIAGRPPREQATRLRPDRIHDSFTARAQSYTSEPDVVENS